MSTPPQTPQTSSLPLHHAQLVETLGRICLQPFDDRDVRLLLLDLRSYIPAGWTHEIADCVGHPEGRDKRSLVRHVEWARNLYVWREAGQLNQNLTRIANADYKFLREFLDTPKHSRTTLLGHLDSMYATVTGAFEHRPGAAPPDRVFLPIAHALVQPLPQNELVSDLCDAIGKAAIDDAHVWQDLLREVANEVAVAVAALLSTVRITRDGAVVAELEIVPRGTIEVSAVLPVPGPKRLCVPVLETSCSESEWATERLEPEFHPGPQGGVEYASRSFVARRVGNDLRLVHAYDACTRLAFQAELVHEMMRDRPGGRPLAEAVRLSRDVIATGRGWDFRGLRPAEDTAR